MVTLKYKLYESLLDDEDDIIKNTNEADVKLQATFGDEYEEIGYADGNNIIYTDLKDMPLNKSQYFKNGLSGEIINDIFEIRNLYNKKYKISDISKNQFIYQK